VTPRDRAGARVPRAADRGAIRFEHRVEDFQARATASSIRSGGFDEKIDQRKMALRV
jgi:hypothetical protein